MPYATRYRCEFGDDKGQDWRLDFVDNNYGGSVQENYVLLASGCNISWSAGTKEKMSPVVTSELSISIAIRDAGEMDMLERIATSAEGRYTVGLYKLDGATATLWWSGVIMADQVTYTESHYPRTTTLTATDDIGNLAELPYDDDGTNYSGAAETVMGNLLTALKKTRQAQYFYGSGDDFICYANDFYSVDDHASVTDHLDTTRLDWSTFYVPDSDGLIEPVTTLQVVESICTVYNSRLCQYAGVWWLLPLGGYQDADTAWTIKTKKYGGGGGSGTLTKTASTGTNLRPLADFSASYWQPFRQTIREQLYWGNAPLILGAAYRLKQHPTLTDQDNDYASGYAFRLSALFRFYATGYNFSGLSTANEKFVGRFLVRITLQVGDHYCHRAASFATDNAYWFNATNGVQYSYKPHEYDDFTWSTSVGYVEVVSPIYNRLIGTGPGFIMGWEDDTTGIPSDLEGASIEAKLYHCNHLGNLTLLEENGSGDLGGSLGDQIYPVAANLGNPFQLKTQGESNTAGDAVVWSAEGTSSNRGDLQQRTVIFGDLISNGARGVLKVKTATSPATYEPSSGWRCTQHTTGTLGVNQLGTQEIQAIHNKTCKGLAGELHGDLLNPTQLLEDSEGDKYLPTSVEIDIHKRMNTFEGYLLVRDTTDVVVNDGHTKDEGGTWTPDSGDPTPEPDGPYVSSIQNQTGDVTLDPDDLNDGTSVNKFVTSAQRDQIGTNQTAITNTNVALGSEILARLAGDAAITAKTDYITVTRNVNLNTHDDKVSLLTLNAGRTAFSDIALDDESIRATKIETDANRSFITQTQKDQITTNQSSISDIEDKTDLISITTQHNLDTTKTKVGHIAADTDGITAFTVKATATPLNADQVSTVSTTNKFATQAQLNKVNFLTVTKTTDLDTIQTKTDAVTVNGAGDITNLSTQGEVINFGAVADTSSYTKLQVTERTNKLNHILGDGTGIAAFAVKSGATPLNADQVTDAATTKKFTDADGKTKLGNLTLGANNKIDTITIEGAYGGGTRTMELGQMHDLLAGNYPSGTCPTTYQYLCNATAALDPINPNDAGHRSSQTGNVVALIDSNGQFSELADGTAGQNLTTDGSGNISWTKPQKGWMGWETAVKVLPHQWTMNDDYNRAPIMVEDDTSGTLGIVMPSSATEAYAMVGIPAGYKATHVQVYASASTASAVTVYDYDHTDGSVTSQGTGAFNSSIDITDVNSGVNTSICIKVAPASTTTLLYGATITIATI